MPAKRTTRGRKAVAGAGVASGNLRAATSGVSQSAKKTPAPRRSSRITAKGAKIAENPALAAATSSDESSCIDQNPHSTRSLNEMPLEVLLRIMSYMSFNEMFKMELVSRRMHAVALTAWKQVRSVSHRTAFYSGHPDLAAAHPNCDLEQHYDDRTVRAVIKRCNVQYLAAGTSLGRCKITSDIFNLSMCMPNLRRLTLEKIALTNRNITTLARYCDQLTYLTFKNCFNGAVVERSLGILFSKCRHLIYVDLTNNFRLKGDALLNLPPTVRLLNLLMNSQISGSTMCSIVKACPSLLCFFFEAAEYTCDAVNSWLRYLPNLRCLEINNMFQDEPTSFLDFSHNTKLEVFDAQDNNYVRSQTLRTLENCKKLRSLTLKYCEYVNSSVLRSLSGCKSLRVLYLSGTYNLSDVSYVVTSCGIQYLRLAHVGELTRESVAKFIDATPTLKRLHTWLRIPPGFTFNEFMEEYFAEQKCKAESDVVIDLHRPMLSRSPLGVVKTDVDFFLRQSALEQWTYQSDGFEKTNFRILR